MKNRKLIKKANWKVLSFYKQQKCKNYEAMIKVVYIKNYGYKAQTF